MKNITIIIILISHFCFSQKREQHKTYLDFDAKSEKTYTVEVNGRIITEQFYSKATNNNKNITFYIGKEMFYFNEKRSRYLQNRIFKKYKNIRFKHP